MNLTVHWAFKYPFIQASITENLLLTMCCIRDQKLQRYMPTIFAHTENRPERWTIFLAVGADSDRLAWRGRGRGYFLFFCKTKCRILPELVFHRQPGTDIGRGSLTALGLGSYSSFGKLLDFMAGARGSHPLPWLNFLPAASFPWLETPLFHCYCSPIVSIFCTLGSL